MRPRTILSAYTLALIRTVQADDEFWDYLEKGLYWRASREMYYCYSCAQRTVRFQQRVLSLIGGTLDEPA